MRTSVLGVVTAARRVRVLLPFGPESADEEPTPGRCQWPFNATWVTADGFVTPCCNLHDPRQLSFGNAFEKPLGDIWLGEAYQTFRTQYRANQVDACRKCPVHYGRFKTYTYERGKS